MLISLANFFLHVLILSESSNKRKFKELVTEFSLTCRGIANTQYAKETTNKY